MKAMGKSLLKALFNKVTVAFMIGAITGVFGINLDQNTRNEIACLIPGLAGCESSVTTPGK